MSDKFQELSHQDSESLLKVSCPEVARLSRFELLNHHLEQFDTYMVCRVMVDKLKEESLLKPVIFVVGGLSGTGKTTLARSIANDYGALHVQADAIRKHFSGIPVNERGPADIYTPEISRETYHGMIERVEAVIRAGMPVVMDGTYMAPYQRIGIEKLAIELGTPIEGFWLKTSLGNQEARVVGRVNSVSDADIDVVKNMYHSHHNIAPHGWRLIDASGTAAQVLHAAKKYVTSYLK